MASMATDDLIADIDEEPEEVDEIPAFVRQLDIETASVKELQERITEAVIQSDPESMSTLNTKLAQTNTRLGRLAAKAKYYARMSERAYRNERERLKLAHMEDGMAAGKAESKAYLQCEELFKSYNEIQLMADEADDTCYRTDTLLKMSQSRLSLIKGDLKRQ